MDTIKSESVFPLIKKRVLQIILLFTAFVLGAAGAQTKSPAVGQGLWIKGSSIGLGGKNSSSDAQIVTYAITLENNESHPVTIVNLIPTPSEEVTKRLTSEDTRLVVGKVIDPGRTLEIKGEFQFNATGVSKGQIDSWGQLITGLQVTTDQVLELPSTP